MQMRRWRTQFGQCCNTHDYRIRSDIGCTGYGPPIHWRTVLPCDRFLEVDYETLVADREAVTRKLITFTGLGWHDACMQPERNGRAVTTASLWQARQPVFRTSVERWRRYEPWLGELRQLLGTSATHPEL